MELIDINSILNRNKIADNIKSFFTEFEKDKNNLTVK